jgi:hypothetical protein
MSVAIAAHSGTSFVPERRGSSERASYVAQLCRARTVMQQHAEKGGTLDKLEEEFERYRGGLRARTLAQLHSRSRCMSTMIAGPSNFPVRRQEKRSAIERKRLEELCAFQEYGLRAAIRNLRPDLRPIMSGDADAIARLALKIASAELLQSRMTLANKVVRAFYKAGVRDASAGEDWQRYVEKLAEVWPDITEGRAKRLLEPDCCGRIAFADYELKNNGANIRRMKQRLEQIERAQSIPDSQVAGANGIKLDDCPAENRIKLTFPGKPSEEVRSKLKKNGFRWTPSQGVWQACRNSSSLALASQMVQA